MTQTNVKVQQSTEYLGTELYGVDRFEIRLANLDTSKVDKSSIGKDGFCDCLSIPLIPEVNEKLAFEQIFCCLVDKVAHNFEDVYPQPVNLNLVIDDSEGDRQYYIEADVQLKSWDGVSTEVSTEEIHLTEKEQATIELALLKITNPEQFILKYTRCQVAQAITIKNKFGLYYDGINDKGSYRSTWLSEDHKLCIIGYIENIKDKNSKIQFLQVGV